jgi:hypothetical protein
MAGDMKSKMFTNKRGGYIVEAAISMPVFMVAIILLSSVILMYSCIEDSGFIGADEMNRAAVEARTVGSQPLLPYETGNRVRTAHRQIRNVAVEEYRYRYSSHGIDDLISMKLRLNMRQSAPLGLTRDASYRLSLITRAYVGRVGSSDPMSEERMRGEGDDPVFVFPKMGEKYHNDSCTFIRAGCAAAPLTHAMRGRYDECEVCRSGSAMIGALVYYFPVSGEAYHLPGCRVLERNYIEMEKSTAVERGYTPCSKCGG